MFDEMLNIHRAVDRLFNEFWSDLPTRTTYPNPGYQLRSTGDAWKLSLPLPGIDPQHASLDVAGTTLSIRIDQPATGDTQNLQYEQSLTVPAFIDLDKVHANHRHGLLEITLPFKEAVKPRRIQIETSNADPKQLNAVA